MSVAWFLGAVADQAQQLAQPQPATAPLTPPLAWWRLAAMGLLFACLLGIWFYLNRSRFSLGSLRSLGSPAAAGRKIEVRDQRWVSSKVAVVLVEVDGQRFLLAHGPDTASWQSLQALPPSPSIPPVS